MLNKLLEHPFVYNLSQKVLSFISMGNTGIPDCLTSTIKPEGEILDVGCGTGRYAYIFKDHYTGTDINPKYIEMAKKSHPETGYKFEVMDATAMSYPDGKFDAVFCVGIFHHLTDAQVNGTCKEMVRLCKNGGQILIIDPVKPGWKNIFGTILFSLDRGANRRTFEELRDLLAPHGILPLNPSLKKSFPWRVSAFRCNKA